MARLAAVARSKSVKTMTDARKPGWACRTAHASAVALASLLAPALASAQPATPSLASETEFRVCADPANLPFSNDKRQGFENKIADLFAGYLHVPVSDVWFPQTVGFLRNTLFAHRCDVVIGTVAGGDMVDTTNAYYHTGYVMVTRAADRVTSADLGDPDFADKRIGLIASTPPTDLVARHHLLAHVTPYHLNVDTRVEQPSEDILHDVAEGKIDIGLVWGPFAGYYIKHDNLPLRMAFLAAEPGGPRLDYRIAMGVRPSDVTFRRKLNALISQHQSEITTLLLSYGVPLLDEQNHPLAVPDETAAKP